jgi:predicted dehydrogenase
MDAHFNFIVHSGYNKANPYLEENKMPIVALVGASHIHTPGFVRKLKERPDIKVKLVWDRYPAVAERQALELNATMVADPKQVWNDPDINAAVICSETNLHKNLVLFAVAAKKHVFVEKPLGIGSQDAIEMAHAITDAGVLFQTGYFNRGNPIYQFMREHISKGSFGRITRIRHSNCHGGGMADWFIDKDWSWMTDPVQAGFGAFGDLGTHSLDLILWMMDRRVEWVSANTQTVNARFGPQCDEYGEGLLLFENGIIGSLAASWVDVANPVVFQLNGTEGNASVVDGKLYLKSEYIEGADGKTPWTDLPAPWPHAFDLFLDAVSGKETPPLVTPREAALNSVVMEALYQSASQRAWVAPLDF